MKKRIFIIIAAFLLLITGCGGEKGATTYQELTLDELTKKIDAKENFVLVLGSSTCSACATYKVTMEEIITKYNLTIYHFDGGELKDEERAKLLSIVYYTSTPTTVYFKDGKAEETHKRLVGAVEYDKAIDFLKQKGYIGK